MTYEHFASWREQEAHGEPALSVVIPTRNDELEIISTTAAVACHLSSNGIDFEILIADGGSTDSTVERVQHLALRNLHMLTTERSRGTGASVRAGVLQSRGRHVLIVDAGLSTPIEQVDRLLAVAAHDGGDLIIGGCQAPDDFDDTDDDDEWSRQRRAGGANKAPLGGLALIERGAARKLFATQRLSGPRFATEVRWRARNRRMHVVEVPANWLRAKPVLGDDPFAPPCKAVVTLPERFDQHAPSELASFIPLRGERVCIDGSQVRLADTIAIQSLIDARLRFLDAGADLYITSPSSSLRITLELTGDDALLTPTTRMNSDRVDVTPPRNVRHSQPRIESQRRER